MYDKIFKNEDGSKTKIRVHIFIDRYRDTGVNHEYQFSVSYCPPNKRKFVNASRDQYTSNQLEEAAN